VKVEAFVRGATGTKLDWSIQSYDTPPVLDFTMAAYDGFVLRVTPEEPVSTDTWWSYSVRLDRWIDTGTFLGWIHLHPGNWVYLLDQDQWVYIPPPGSDSPGAWAYFRKP
jgi:hypothetical protein